LEPGVGVEPTSAIPWNVYCGSLLGYSAARRLSRSAFGGQANPGFGSKPPALTAVAYKNRISLFKKAFS